MKVNNLKQDFIDAFGEEKWNIEEALDKLKPISKKLAEYLDVNELIIVCEDIPEDSRLYMKEEYIIISKRLVLNYIEGLKCLAHEYRHFYQWICIKEERYDEVLLDYYAEDFQARAINQSVVAGTEDYYSLVIELDAFAFQKYYLKKELNIETHFPNEEYDKVLDKFIRKYLE